MNWSFRLATGFSETIKFRLRIATPDLMMTEHCEAFHTSYRMNNHQLLLPLNNCLPCNQKEPTV